MTSSGRSRPPDHARKTRHPVARLGGTAARFPRYVRLGHGLLGEPRLSRKRKLALGAAIGYVAMPVDFVPGIIPVAGQLDDLAALLLALRAALGGLPPEVKAEHFARVGLSPTALDADVANVAAATRWVLGKVAEVGVRAVALPFKAIGWAFDRAVAERTRARRA